MFKRPILFHFSTDEVYGDIKEGSHKETDILTPSNPYSASKAAADMLIMAWARTYDIEYVILRPTNNYGIGQYCEKLIPLSIKLLQLGRKINLHDEGKPVRNWLHADDTAEAVITIIKSGITNEIFNVSGNLEQENIITATNILEAFLGKKNVDTNQYFNLQFKRRGQDVRYALDDTKLRNLGWSNKIIFLNELPSIIEYYKNNFKW